MSVNPDLEWQKFIESATKKVERLRQLINKIVKHSSKLMEVYRQIQPKTCQSRSKYLVSVVMFSKQLTLATDTLTKRIRDIVEDILKKLHT